MYSKHIKTAFSATLTNQALGRCGILVQKLCREPDSPEIQHCTCVHHREKTPGPLLHRDAVCNTTVNKRHTTYKCDPHALSTPL